MTRRIHLGISTCPNDTFTFHALLTGQISTPGIEFDIELLDVETLNERLIHGDFDVAKGSFHAALRACAAGPSTGTLGVLPTGSALGFGNGPLLLSSTPGVRPGPGDEVLCPGRYTTAALLQDLYFPGCPLRHAVFSDIMPALQAGQVSFGVCIHEGRFTYPEQGLHLVADLGELWEADTQRPLPLGGIFARPGLGSNTLRSIQQALAKSLAFAQAQPEAALPSMRAHAQELSDEVLMAHVDLYVNPWTRDLGREGQAALEALAERGRQAKILPAATSHLEVLGRPRSFHICEPSARDKLLIQGQDWAPPSLTDEGFVHLSFLEQLPGTLRTHFLEPLGEARPAGLCLLELDAQTIGPMLELEPARQGELFAHLYRPIQPTDVIGTWPLQWNEDQWLLPPL